MPLLATVPLKQEIMKQDNFIAFMSPLFELRGLCRQMDKQSNHANPSKMADLPENIINQREMNSQ